MANIYIKSDRRGRGSTAGESFAPAEGKLDRRIYCWDVHGCVETARRECPAYNVRRSCWDLWGVRGFSGQDKPCCLKHDDCRECPLPLTKFGDVLPVHLTTRAGPARSMVSPFANICPHLLVKGTCATSDPKSLLDELKNLLQEDKNILSCRVRRGIYLYSDYVNDMCRSRRYRQCLFFLEP